MSGEPGDLWAPRLVRFLHVRGSFFEVARTEQSLQIQEHECFVEVRSRTQRCFCGPVDAAGITEAAPANRRHELAAAYPTRRRKLTVAVSSRSCQLRCQHELCLKCRQAAVIQRPLMTGRAFGAFQPQSKVDSMRSFNFTHFRPPHIPQPFQ